MSGTFRMSNYEKLLNTINGHSELRDSPYRTILDQIKDQDIFYVEIGSCDGVFPIDPLYIHSYPNKHWRGVMVEPVPYYFEKLKENYDNRENISFVNAAITPENGEVTMHVVDPSKVESGEVKFWARGVSTLEPESHSAIIKNNLQSSMIEQKVRGITFETLVKENNIEKIDVLQIDVEGCDLTILMNVWDSGFLPKLINVEVIHMTDEQRTEIRERAEKLGYQVTKAHNDYIIAHNLLLGY